MSFSGRLIQILSLLIVLAVAVVLVSSWLGNDLTSRIGEHPLTTPTILLVILTILVVQIGRELAALGAVKQPKTWSGREFNEVPEAAKPIISKVFSGLIIVRLIVHIAIAILLCVVFYFTLVKR